MLTEKQKNLTSFELYASRKNREPDYLCNVIKKYRHIQKIQQADTDPAYEEQVKRALNQKRIEEIKKMYKTKKVSQPDAYVKRTWVSPLSSSQKKQQISYCLWKKSSSPDQSLATISDQEKTKKILSVLNMNKKMRLFGEYMFCQFEDKEKENTKTLNRSKSTRKMDLMHKQYSRLMNCAKKSIVVCNKNSDLNKKVFYNPLEEDKFYQRIIGRKDQELTKLLIDTLSMSGTFTFSSYILFYELFVWQQAPKQTQIDFVVRMLMGSATEISFDNLSSMIDLMCSKINLVEHKDSLSGFNEVMKKLIFGAHYEYAHNPNFYMTRKNLCYSLELNEQCISIFINVFYSQ